MFFNDAFQRTQDIKSGTPAFPIPPGPWETSNDGFGKDLRIDWCFGVHPRVLLHSRAEILPQFSEQSSPEIWDGKPYCSAASDNQESPTADRNWLRVRGFVGAVHL